MRISDWSSDVCSSDLHNLRWQRSPPLTFCGCRWLTDAPYVQAPGRICCRSGFPGSDYRSRSEEHTSELQSLMRISYAVFCLKNKKNNRAKIKNTHKK